jgi:hypothetical protein
MKLAMAPNRSTDAIRSIRPTRTVSVVAAVSSWTGSPLGTTAASWAPVRMPMVVVVLTLSGRDVPRKA